MAFNTFALAFMALFATCTAMSYNFGYPNATDIIVLNEDIIYPAYANAQVTVNVDFPKSGQNNTRQITAIRIKDKIRNYNGADAEIWYGGLGETFVRIHLKSQVDKGIKSTIEIYGAN